MTPKLALLLPCEEQSSSEEVDVGPFESSSSSVVSSPSPSPSLSPRAVGYGALDNRRPDLEEECNNSSNNSSSCDEEELHGEEQDQVRVPPLVVRDYRVTNNSNSNYDYETGDFPELAARRSASYSGTTSLMVNIEEWRQLFYFGIIVLTMVIIIFGVVLVGGDSFVATTGGGGGGMSNDRSGGLGLATAAAAAAAAAATN